MGKNKKVEKWIDLSELPRHNSGRINWRKSSGILVPFRYGEKCGTIKILDCFQGDKYNVELAIDNETIRYVLSGDEIGSCKFGGALIKPIAETNPELIRYFVNQSDAYKYTRGSGKKVAMRCLFCGAIKPQVIQTLAKYGFACPVCSDGISWPNKFMFAVLKQLNISFMREVTCATPGFEWIPSHYRYDFFVYNNNRSVLVEMDGHFHFIDGFKPREKSQSIDAMKDNLAKRRGLEVIRINCQYDKVDNRYQYICTNIMNSLLAKVLDLSNVNWEEARNTANMSNSMYEAAKYWNDGMAVTAIARKMQIGVTTVSHKLKIASEMGLCDYTVEKSKHNGRENSHSIIRRIRSKHVAVFYNDIQVGVFYSGVELSKQSRQLYGEFFSGPAISYVCNGKKESLYGYKMKYISDDEYEMMSQQYKINEEVKKT